MSHCSSQNKKNIDFPISEQQYVKLVLIKQKGMAF